MVDMLVDMRRMDGGDGVFEFFSDSDEEIFAIGHHYFFLDKRG